MSVRPTGPSEFPLERTPFPKGKTEADLGNELMNNIATQQIMTSLMEINICKATE